MEATARDHPEPGVRQRFHGTVRHCAGQNGRPVARELPGRSLPFEGTLLPGCPGRSKLRQAILWNVSLPTVVVRGVVGSSSRR